ncbi:GNAT family N-acetyltransferase [Streptomyces stramineus]|uniref:N-acetyltransferase domain-containing protein n=1 Tax=Streptomyces stramineus TaxID=173861 RepID=A0ABN0ZGW9_9ACTN
MPRIEQPAMTYRTARPGEEKDIEGIDNSFTTSFVLEVTAAETGFTLREVAVDPPLRKVFPAEEATGDAGEETGGHTVVACDATGAVCGAVTVEYARWNRRLVIADVRVAPEHRGRGVGSALMSRALDHGRALGARTAWLEVTSVNAPAVRAYRRMGFALCGLDTSLYTGTASEGEQALFMSRSL